MKKNIWIVVLMVLLFAVSTVRAEVKVASAEKGAALKCDGGICWPKSPRGNYFGIGTLGNAKLVGNANNPKYPSNSISAKMEYHSGIWSPRVVVRNITATTEALLTTELRQKIASHLAKIGSLKVGQSAKEGDSCFEKTWIVNPKTGTWSIRK